MTDTSAGNTRETRMFGVAYYMYLSNYKIRFVGEGQ